jgi:hypothetical protein
MISSSRKYNSSGKNKNMSFVSSNIKDKDNFNSNNYYMN